MCSLSHHQLGTVPFEALSYTWDGSQREIMCNDCTFSVADNLYSALKRLRYEDKDRVLWIDAICINQNDNAEKMMQVGIMGEIYGGAEKVMVWLGEEREEDCKAIDMINLIQEFRKNLRNGSGAESQSIMHKLLDKKELPEDGWKHLGALLQRPYFKRLWVIQEIVNARDCTIVCGTKSVKWKDFGGVTVLLAGSAGKEFPTSLEVPGISEIMTSNALFIHSLRESRGPGKVFGISDLLWTSRVFQTSEPRDRIFALLGIPIQEGEVAPLPDYCSTDFEVFKNFTLLELQHSTEMNLLSFVNLDGKDQDIEVTGASWVPDLGYKDKSTAPMFLIFAWSCSISASGKTTKDLKIDEGKTILTIKGRLLEPMDFVGLTRDSVYESFSVEDPRNDSEFGIAINDELQVERTWLSSCLAVMMGSSPIPMDEFIYLEQFQIFVELMCYNWDQERQGAPTLDTIKEVQLAIVGLLSRWENWDPKKKYRNLMIGGHTLYKSLCRMGERFVGWMPGNAKEGDVVAIFNGAKVPYLLRPMEDGAYQLLGECWISGMMSGAVMQMDEFNEQELRVC